jgi:hypothetical protein
LRNCSVSTFSGVKEIFFRRHGGQQRFRELAAFVTFLQGRDPVGMGLNQSA